MMLLSMHGLWTAYVFLVQTKPSIMYLGWIQDWKEFGVYGKRKVNAKFVFPFLRQESA